MAQYRLATLYQHGAPSNAAQADAFGAYFAPDATKALHWLREAALNGYDEAQFRLAVKLQSGDGVAQDTHEAMEWYGKAAAAGNSGAQHLLGVLSRGSAASAGQPSSAS